MTVEELLPRLQDVRRAGSEWAARCPAHEDLEPSLTVRQADDGRVLVHCHAGCAPSAVTDALGLRMRDLMPADMPSPQPSEQRRIVAQYNYADANGRLLYQVVRYDPKNFRQRRPDGANGWTWTLNGVPRVPYRLPDLARAVQRGDGCFLIVEGEKDADNLWRLDLPATSNAGGAGKWGEAETEALAKVLPTGAQVVALPDNDPAGHAHAAQVVFHLRRAGLSARVLELPGLPAKGDVTDWLNAGGSVDKLQRLLAGAETSTATQVFATSDLGNAERLRARHGKDLRFAPQRGAWLVWDGHRWDWDETGAVMRYAHDTVRHIGAEATALEDPVARRAMLKWAKQSENHPQLIHMVAQALKLDGWQVLQADLDRDPWALNVLNGTVDLQSGELRSHRRADLLSKLAPVQYDPEAACPRWESFLQRITNGNINLIQFLQRMAGYGLTGDTSEQCLFLLHGSGANGKSTFCEVLRALLGDYAAQTDFSTFLASDEGRVRNDLARLAGTRLVTAVEVEAGRRLAEVIVKQVTGQDRITARFLFREYFEFTPAFKVLLAANHKPVIRGTDHAIWRRIRLVPFDVTIPEPERDRHLLAKLREELPGILRWAVHGALAWQLDGLQPPEEVRRATDAYREESDALAGFLGECCLVGQGHKALAKELYKAYGQLCEENGDKPLSQKTFGLRLGERGFVRDRGTGNKHFWFGIGLAQSDRSDPL